LLRSAGHRVEIAQEFDRQSCDILVALHARRSHEAVAQFREAAPGKPVVVALTGTDLYQDLPESREAQLSLDWADRVVLLQEEGLRRLRPEIRPKARVIYQSVVLTRRARQAASSPNRFEPRGTFDVCVVGHLRDVKDPFRAAEASRLLPSSSRIRVVHVGGAMDDQSAERAAREAKENARYRWLGERPRWQVFLLLAHCQAFALTSKLEGGANALGEAIVAGAPVLASRIDGSIGLLGPEHPGFFPVGASEDLAELMDRCERDQQFLLELKRRSMQRAPLFDPAREASAWTSLIGELSRLDNPR
jgi:putative glycosyltransferase (TIGR04348 family)